MNSSARPATTTSTAPAPSNPEALERAAHVLSRADSVMEVTVLETVRVFVRSGGTPHRAVELLSDSYQGIAQSANLMREWLTLLDESVEETDARIHAHLQDRAFECFDVAKADMIFTASSTVPEWFSHLVVDPSWQNVFYRLANKFPHSLMLQYILASLSRGAAALANTTSAPVSEAVPVEPDSSSPPTSASSLPSSTSAPNSSSSSFTTPTPRHRSLCSL